MLPKALFWHLDSAPSPIFREAVWERDVGVLVGALWLQHGLGGFTVLGTVRVVLSFQGLSERLTSGQSRFGSWWPGITRKLELQILNLQHAPRLQLIDQGNLWKRDCELDDPVIRSCGSWAAEDVWQGQREASLLLVVSVGLDPLYMLPLGIFKGLQIREDEELCISWWKAPSLVQATTS